MPEVLAASLAFPTLIFTGVLALAAIYWLFVILGALDLDLLGGADADLQIDLDGVAKGALEGATKGVLEGATKGALEGATKGALEGAAKGSLEGAAKGSLEGADGGADEGGLADLFAALQLHRAPATVVLTLLAIFGWLTSVLALLNLSSAWHAWGLPGWAFKGLVLATSIVVAFPLTSLAVRPLAPFFATRAAQSRKDLVGRVVVVSTGRVDERFGQATLEDGGAGLILDVRCDTPGLLRQGDRVLLVSWDDSKEAFLVEPMEDVLTERRIEAAARGARVVNDAQPSVTAPTAPERNAAAGADTDADPHMDEPDPSAELRRRAG